MRVILTGIFLFLLYVSKGQYNFRSPIDSEIKLAANFGELRDNHFHSGLDIITGSVEGWNVYAVEDGYVSRIVSSKKGYGNALYINHPNGITSVYGHLQRYNDAIKKFETTCQYAQEDFELDTILIPYVLPVKRGEIIALSGNTGGSTGPHLHFELRDTKTEFVLNPENFGFEVTDNIAPKIYSVSLYSLNNIQPEFLQTISLIGGKTITIIPGSVGLGISGRDYYSDYEFTAGIYQTQLYANDQLIYEKRMDTFSFDNWRCINAHIDYGILKTKGYFIEKCFKADGNLAEIYYHLKDDGKIQINPGEIVQIRIVTKDHAGNTTAVSFGLKGGLKLNKPKSKYNVLPVSKNELKAKKASLAIPSGAVYDTCLFAFYADSTYKRYSYKYIVGNTIIPLQKEIELKLTPLFLPKAGVKKLYIKSLGAGSVGGIYTEGMMKAKTKICGIYIIDIDTLPPIITPINIPASKNISNNATLKFTIYDTQTGVKKFKATANGKYILFRYDLKYNLITCNLDDVDLPGQTEFELVVEDYCGNIKKYRTLLTKN